MSIGGFVEQNITADEREAKETLRRQQLLRLAMNSRWPEIPRSRLVFRRHNIVEDTQDGRLYARMWGRSQTRSSRPRSRSTSRRTETPSSSRNHQGRRASPRWRSTGYDASGDAPSRQRRAGDVRRDALRLHQVRAPLQPRAPAA